MAEHSDRFHQQTTRRRFLQHVRWATAGVVASALPVSRGDATPQALRVAFVGTSFTWWEQVYERSQSVPKIVEQLGMADNPLQQITTEMFILQGVNLRDHWAYFGKNVQSVMEGNWDYVVLQDLAQRPLEEPDSFSEYAKRWALGVREKTGAVPVFFHPWALGEGRWEYNTDWGAGGPAEWHNKTRAAYDRVASATGAMVAPVGEAWNQAGRTVPKAQLFASDRRHPAPHGQYLTACTIYRTLVGRPINAESVPSWILADVGRALQKIANDVCARQGGAP